MLITNHRQNCRLSNETFLNYDGLKMVYEGRSFPGGGHLDVGVYEDELNIFDSVLANMKADKPVMMELGCHWALWSLLFRKRFASGRNVIVDIGKAQLDVGRLNFALNGYDVSAYHGAFFREKSETYEKKDTQLKEGVGENLDFFKVCKDESIRTIDLLHMDIQGSELAFVQNTLPFFESKLISNIVICTHDHLVPPVHKSIVDILRRYSYQIHVDINSLNFDDGYIYASV